MAAGERHAGPFLIIHRFMWSEMGLSGVTLHVYARIYGFCHDGGGRFYESRSATARFLGTTSRTVSRSVAELLACGLIHEEGEHVNANGSVTRSYGIDLGAVELAREEEQHAHVPMFDEHASVRQGGKVAPGEASPPDNRSFPDDSTPPDKTSGDETLNPDGTSGDPVTGCHPIRKSERKGQ